MDQLLFASDQRVCRPSLGLHCQLHNLHRSSGDSHGERYSWQVSAFVICSKSANKGIGWSISHWSATTELSVSYWSSSVSLKVDHNSAGVRPLKVFQCWITIISVSTFSPALSRWRSCLIPLHWFLLNVNCTYLPILPHLPPWNLSSGALLCHHGWSLGGDDIEAPAHCTSGNRCCFPGPFRLALWWVGPNFIANQNFPEHRR